MQFLSNHNIEIVPYQLKHQKGIDQLINNIAEEFQKPISVGNAHINVTQPDKYWVAKKEMNIVGTIAMLKINKHQCTLKSMFVAKMFRGREKGVSNLLLQTALKWCKEEGITSIYLGTMSQFNRAHNFYEKNGFYKIKNTRLPSGYIQNPIDDIFYMKTLNLK